MRTDKGPHRIGQAADNGRSGAAASSRCSRWPAPAPSAARISSSSAGIEQQHRQLAIAVEQRLHQPASQRLARRLHQRHQALVHRSGFEQRFENRSQVADRDPLPQQLLQHPRHFAQRQQLGHQLFEQLGMAVVQRVQQPLDLGPSQQLPACWRISSPR